MKKVILPAVLVGFLVMAAPAPAMMEGMHSGMHSGSGSENPAGTQQPGETQTWHRHGEYYHSHESGELPHSHYQEKDAARSAPASSPKKQPSTEKKSSSKKSVQKKEVSNAAPKFPSENKSAKVSAPGAGIPVLNWKDDMVLHKVPEGRLISGEESRNVQSFYMDETQVTNHQYVEFLNQVLPKIRLENGVVKEDGEIWLLLGEVKEGYEPIIFEHGRFRVNGVHHAACAVLRVTAYGAAAYADYYGKRLPTEAEWLYTLQSGGSAGGSLPIPSPVILYAADKFGIRGLDSNIGEWVVRENLASAKQGRSPEYVVLEGNGDDASKVAVIRRYPWEAFAEVSFRTVVDASTAAEQSPQGSKSEQN